MTTVTFEATTIGDIAAPLELTIVTCFNVSFGVVAIVDEEIAILFLVLMVVVDATADGDEAILTTLYFPRS